MKLVWIGHGVTVPSRVENRERHTFSKSCSRGNSEDTILNSRGPRALAALCAPPELTSANLPRLNRPLTKSRRFSAVMASDPPISLKAAREALGVGPFFTPSDLRRAFREAAKRAHPDRAGGGAERFRQVVEAYHRLKAVQAGPDRIIQPPARRAPEPAVLNIDPLVALRGGSAERRLADGRRVRIRLPAGLRSGDSIRAGETELEVVLHGTPDMLVRGDDIWINAAVSPRTLAEGGRVAIDTPLGRRIVWLTRKAGERKLVRLVGQGLPARGSHGQGHLFLRLDPAKAGQADSAARTLLRRFTAAWAA
jgi:curved DNA-binding protein